MEQQINYKLFLPIILMVFITSFSFAQDQEELKISGNYRNTPISEFIHSLETEYNLHVFYKDSWIEADTITVNFNDIPLERALNTVFNQQELTYEIFQDNSIFIFPREMDTRIKYDGADNIIVIGSPLNVGRYKTATLTGRILDGKTGEPLPGAVIYNDKLDQGATSSVNGEFKMEMPTGEQTLQVSFVGFQSSVFRIRMIEDGERDLDLFEEVHNLSEVVVLGTRMDLPHSQTSMVQMSGKEIKQMPALMGEVDVLKGLTMLAGVQTVSELASGFNVRGGNTDQNLILINGSPVFNSSHLFGFLSLINPDVVEDVRLFKGGMPVKFGERIASVMEVDFKEGNSETIHVYGGLGVINSRLTLDGPLSKDKKLTLIAGARSSYTNWILKELPDVELSQSVTNFYDASGKLTYKFDQYNKISIMGYSSNDEFNTSSQSLTKYGNILGNFKLTTRFNETLNGDLEISYSKYNYRLTDKANGTPEEAYYLDNSISYTSAGYNFRWHPLQRHNTTFGFKAIYNIINPGEITPVNDISVIGNTKLVEEKALEWAGYLGDEFEFSPRSSFSAGIRFSHFGNIGTPVVYVYDPEKTMAPENVIDSLTFGSNESSKTYAGIEPRVSFNYDISDNTTLKLSYQRTRQYLFQLSNNTVISPAETWKAADYHLKPLISDQFVFGVDNNSLIDNLDLTAEVYFKNLQNLIEYKNGATLIMNEHVETALIPTKGYSYGIELSARKNSGRLTGYMSYVFSRTMRKNESKFDDENFWKGDYYPSIYDKPHDFSITGTYNITRRWKLSGNFVFISGRPVTLPEIKYRYAGETLIYYSERNKYRMPSYHRFDISLTFDENLKRKRSWKGSWTISVYNVYGRDNPYSIYYRKIDNPVDINYNQYALYKLSVIGIPVPSITYNFRF